MWELISLRQKNEVSSYMWDYDYLTAACWDRNCLSIAPSHCTLLYTDKNEWLCDHLLIFCLHDNKMAQIVQKPEHGRGVSVCCICHCWNKFESFPPAGTKHIRMIHSLGVWRESCNSLQFYCLLVLFLLMLLTIAQRYISHCNQRPTISHSLNVFD